MLGTRITTNAVGGIDLPQHILESSSIKIIFGCGGWELGILLLALQTLCNVTLMD